MQHKKGRNRTPEQIAKHAAAIRGRPLSAEHRAKLSAATRGKPLNEKQAAHLAEMQAMRRGTIHTPETREKMQANHFFRRELPSELREIVLRIAAEDRYDGENETGR